MLLLLLLPSGLFAPLVWVPFEDASLFRRPFPQTTFVLWRWLLFPVAFVVEHRTRLLLGLLYPVLLRLFGLFWPLRVPPAASFPALALLVSDALVVQLWLPCPESEWVVLV